MVVVVAMAGMKPRRLRVRIILALKVSGGGDVFFFVTVLFAARV
jgi:hypothetical protein